MYASAFHLYSHNLARVRAKLIWFVTALLAGSVALAPVYLHRSGAAGLFSVHATEHIATAHTDTVHTGTVDKTAHDAMTMPVDTLPTGPDAPAPKHEGHAFCFFCVVLMTLQPGVVNLARLWLPTLPELPLFDLEPQLKLYKEFEARPRAPPLV